MTSTSLSQSKKKMLEVEQPLKPETGVTTTRDEETGNGRASEDDAAPRFSRSTKILLITISVLLVVSIVVVSVLLTYDGKDREEPVSPPQGSPSDPIFSVPTPEPQPVAGPTTASSTASPTAAPPTLSPTFSLRTEVTSFLSANGVVIDDSNTASSQAVTALVEENESLDTSDPEKFVQRFAMFALSFGVQGSVDQRFLQTTSPLGLPGVDECSWSGVTCTNGTVTEIRSGSRGFSGSIPSEIGLLTALTYLDLSQNQIGGSIPEELYSLTDLEMLFLYKNQLSGSISSSAGNWWNLRDMHLSHNQLTGSIPSNLGPSSSQFRSFHYVNLKSNNLSGSIPSGLRWRDLFSLDLGFNSLTGTLPVDLGENFGSLRNLHLDHNQFVGTLPESYINVGNGRLESFAINDNLLTGEVPDNHVLFNKLVMFTMQNNNFNVELRDTCRLTVYQGGENVELKADCDICSCRGDFACQDCSG